MTSKQLRKKILARILKCNLELRSATTGKKYNSLIKERDKDIETIIQKARLNWEQSAINKYLRDIN
ncbi:hypothetical protein A2Z67_02485 [Candidatus Woesebacteria bacterium RBG_13_36_22]|uniref:Uncharacterized protein n=1 Tax=Candidatus Woesebacteria bacterium RBG_13_36_22 TaxID=1802478 RepID=A0A1F7X188_9BACT|nr:MAG: hypothetical protein A2Z67_02485 [Candidatus Woesebacteria bacterium RBG_13_36_22]